MNFKNKYQKDLVEYLLTNELYNFTQETPDHIIQDTVDLYNQVANKPITVEYVKKYMI